MSNNPLTKQKSLEELAKQCTEQCELGADVFDIFLMACFQAKALGIDECINDIDSMLNSNTQHLTRNEKNILIQTLDNLRISYAYKRQLIIKNYDENEFS